MEVHKHPHHITHTKKWGEYLLEFFMLFLAVFLGFLAENYREHIVEHKREKEYIQSLVEDLKTDTAKISRGIRLNDRNVKGYDSLVSLLFNPPYSDSALRTLYYLNRRYSGARNAVSFTKRTMNELKNAGGMRLIRNKKVSDSLISYDERTASAEFQINGFSTAFQIPALQTSYQIFNGKYYQGIVRNTANNILKDSAPMQLLTTDPKDLIFFANQSLGAQGALKGYVDHLKSLHNISERLIRLLQSEYHLEKE